MGKKYIVIEEFDAMEVEKKVNSSLAEWYVCNWNLLQWKSDSWEFYYIQAMIKQEK